MKFVFFILITLIVFVGCKSKVTYIPVEYISTEYKDKLHRDSIYLYDSVIVKMKNDTVWLEKYKYLYKDKLIRDSIFKIDSIPYPVEVPGPEVNKLSSFQSFQLWCGRILLLILIAWLGIKSIKK